ncbi:High-affinity branched-chain amino acid transport ATP-binding protein LivF [Pseudodesulfovibrio hydrargyri]|uniref:High-affinity branched-chain amino acid transport ATP-binding protein LivF n=1 Tax=Pseudodesulfovibrio hydrargyri TaxID=2125990 RepID=A0A1J5MT36_9BACT|nr:urea ABC transporter ATP-binding subunit UrtE [Pseudodesulfovibrio hydrargyri]OIQ49028.1 High-affinity branched-chain amino acid transport ATP-binding protein LivF [Pseudodesulfovibrio hydrargyri]
MFTVTGLNQYYGGSHILRDVNLHIDKGSCVCLMGRNGVGKTTLLKSVMGLIPIRSGSIELDGEDLARDPAAARARKGIGYVPQGREIFPGLTVEENLRVGLTGRRDGSKVIPEDIYEFFPVLKEMLHRKGGDLSGGQQQQLAIGRALASDPHMLILDEPTEGIQPNIVQLIGDIIIRLNDEKGLTVLLVEQKLKFARKVGRQFYIMDRGHTVAEGRMDALDDTLISEYLTV